MATHSLRELLEALETAVLDVHRCEDAVQAAAEGQKHAQAAATEVRNRTTAAALNDRQAAEEVYQAALAVANGLYTDAVASAKAETDAARARHAAACAVADPLLKDLQTRTGGVAAGGRLRP